MQIIKQLYQISLRQREPEDLDYSLEAAIVLIMAIVFLRYVSFSSAPMSPLSAPFAYSLTSILGEVLVIYALLRSQGKANRIVQTITALFGVTVLITTVSVLLTLTVILQIVVPFLLIWTVYLMVLILRSALECSTIKALLLTIVYNVAGSLITVLLFPKFQTEMHEILNGMRTAIEAAQIEAQAK